MRFLRILPPPVGSIRVLLLLSVCGVGDDLLGDCCRETGEDWSLTDLSVRSKTSLLKFLVSQSMKTDLLK